MNSPETIPSYSAQAPRRHTTNDFDRLLSGRAFVVLTAISFVIAAVALLH